MANDGADRVWMWIVGSIFISLVALAFVPGPRAIVRNDLRYLRGDWYARNEYGHQASRSFASGVLNPSTWTSKSRNSRLARALESNFRGLIGGPAESLRLKSLEDYCDENPNDVEGWAHLARLATQVCRPSSDVSKVRPENWSAWVRSRDLELKASEAGMRLDPQNAYFPLIHAGAKMASGDGRSALADYLVASKLSSYRDYTRVSILTLERAVADNYGEIGSPEKLRIRLEVLLPQCAYIKSESQLLGERFPQNSKELREARCRVGDLMMRSSDMVITSLVGSAIVREMLKLPPTSKTFALETGGVYQAAIDRAERAKTAQASVGPSPNLDAISKMIEAWRPRAGASAVAAIIASMPIALLMAWGARRRIQRGSIGTGSILPYLAIQIVLVTAVILVVYGASTPSPNLSPIVVVAIATAGWMGSLFAPPGQMSAWKIGGPVTVIATVAFLVTFAMDMRIELAASKALADWDSWDQRVLHSIR